MSPGTVSDEEKGTNALSIDAGSLAAIMSSIGVLEELMRRVQKLSGLSKLPNPCEHFDLMAGAGFAGLLIIMLGRLKMSLDDAKLHCITIVNEVFSEKKLFNSGESFKAVKLEAAVKRMLESCGAGSDARMIEAHAPENKSCKVMVCVHLEHIMNIDMPVCLRTYTAERNSVPDCTIVEAVRATFALPGLFKPAMITEPGGIKVSYVGLGGMNPTTQLLEEAAYVFLGGHISSVMSIGAGQKQTTAILSERPAQEMTARFSNTPGVYFRFSVEQGMQDIGLSDWTELSKGILHARAYLALSENETRISELAQALDARKKAVPVARLNGAIHIVSNAHQRLKECPPPSPLFVGRETQLGCMKRCLVNGSEERHVCVLHGLGGAGKTQLALKFVELYKNKYQHIFYIDSSSAQTIETDLKNIAIVKHAGNNSNDALAWLAHLRENWLVVYNNADDTKLNLRGYFPPCSHGNILITTRNRRMINLAQGVDAECHVLKMSQEDAEKLLAKVAGVTEDVGPAGLALIKELDCFALAVVQAGAYIHTRCCTIADYLDMYKESRGQLLEEYAELVEKADDYERTAYATWRVSYAQLKPTTKMLYDMLAFMHHDQITEDIFRYAVIGLEEDQWNPPPNSNGFVIQETIKSVLANFTRLTDGSWDKAGFMRVIDDLQSYSLLEYDGLNRTYSIHPLVHAWTRTMVSDGPIVCSCTSFLLALSVRRRYQAEDMAFRRTLLVHIDCLPSGEKLRPLFAERFGLVYHEAERGNDTESLAKIALEVNIAVYGREHPSTLDTMNNLALTYSKQGRWREAEVLERQVLELSKRVRGSENPGTLTILNNLALMYSDQGRWREAEVLARQALELSKRVQGREHPATVSSMGHLAVTYSNQGRWQEAEVLQREGIEIRKRVQGSDHPDTLMSMGNLAVTYLRQSRWKEAEVLHMRVLELTKQAKGTEHPSTLISMSNLASTYSNQGRLQEAEVLQKEVLELNKRVQGSEHPNTQSYISNLALTYWKQGRWKEAEVLGQEGLEFSRRMLGSEHPSTLNCMNNLAATYWSQGRWQEAKVLGQEGLELRKRMQGEEHPDTLTSMELLAVTYFSLGQFHRAKMLMESAADMSKRVLGETHPDTVLRLQILAHFETRILVRKVVFFTVDILYPWHSYFLFFAIVMIRSLLVFLTNLACYLWSMF